MVDFIPQQPQIDPTPANWLGWSKPAQAPTPDRSGEIALKTIGKGLEGAADVGGSVVKELGRSGAEDILNTQIQGAEAANVLYKSQDPNNPQLPQDVADAKKVVESLGSSKANGAITPTYYYGQLLKFQKDFRSGPLGMFYSKQFDEGVRDATGVAHTANEYYTHLLSDLNSYLSKPDERAKAAIQEANQGDMMGVASIHDAYQNYQANKTMENLIKLENATSAEKGRRWKNTKALQDHQVNEAGLADSRENAEMVATNIARGMVADNLKVAMNRAGLHSEQDYLDALDTSKHDPQSLQAAIEEYGKLGPRLAAQLRKRFDEVQEFTDSTGVTRRFTINQMLKGNADEVIKRAMSDYTDIGGYIKDGQWGPAAHFANQSKAIDEHIISDMDKSEFGTAVRMYSILKNKVGGDAPWINDLNKSFIQQKLGTWKPFVESMITKSYVPGIDVDTQGQGAKKTTFQQDVDKLVAIGAKSPAVMKTFIEDMARLSDPSMPPEQKAAKLRYMFDFSNRNVLNTWTREDQPGAFAAMTSKPVVEAAKEVEKNYPGTWAMFKSTASTMADNALHNQIPILNQMQNREGWTVRYLTGEGRDSFHGFEINPPEDSRRYPQAYSIAKQQGIKITNGVNSVVRRLVDIAHAEGRDPDAYVFQTLKNAGYQEVPAGKEAQSYPKAMADALIATRAKAAKDAEEEQKQQDEVRKRGEQMLKEKMRP